MDDLYFTHLQDSPCSSYAPALEGHVPTEFVTSASDPEHDDVKVSGTCTDNQSYLTPTCGSAEVLDYMQLAVASSKPTTRGRRAAHASVEMRYRARLNAQVDKLEYVLHRIAPVTDMEDSFSDRARTRPKCQTIDSATSEISNLWSRYKKQRGQNKDLSYRVRGLQKLAFCENCPLMEAAHSQMSPTHDCGQICVDVLLV
ncbi:hypothetical protein AUEXF2481DRAFT_33725 [Aureobasidium subglaciale EXF-2481]|uniref:BHLH domain-containing protein n=1 Tax=Aureobasidium subglaciale (strain EXF-2481) TaxID=1043005 RepID=A0A074XZ08_AURSE|nr:uncharacterized protein AUEXF2481DRAFT_33725 [Aureobasidium subglaciale EXF-2481]KEQ90783.1 hypothetical protein AUEXF2481DRAFT_33725 [Aureobasidium subglaciale EXF-2481]